MPGKSWWPWSRQDRLPAPAPEPAPEAVPVVSPPAPLFTQTSRYRFQSILESVFQPYLARNNRVTLDGRVLALEHICRDSGLLGAWVALADLKAREDGRMLVTRWSKHGGLVDLLPLSWRSDLVDVDDLLVSLIAPWLEQDHIELGAVFMPVAEAAALGNIPGIAPCILGWRHPEGVEIIPLVKPATLPGASSSADMAELFYQAGQRDVTECLVAEADEATQEPEMKDNLRVPAAAVAHSERSRVVGRRYLWCNTGVPPVRRSELDLYEATVNRLEQGLDVIGWPHPEVWRGLRQEFPWALAACQEIEKLAELAYFVKQPGFRLPPLLLVGAPGNGKTRLAERMAEIAGVPRFGISGAGRNNGQVLVGVGRSWSNCQPGGLLQFIAKRGVANPVVVLDEVDKASQQNQYGDLASALLPFLEPESAKAVTDDFLMGETDMSGVSWIATANDASVLPGPLLSRFKVIEVGHPSWDHLPVLCEGIRQDLARQFEVPVDNLPELTSTDLARLRKQMGPTFSARQARLACEALLAERARLGRLEMVR